MATRITGLEEAIRKLDRLGANLFKPMNEAAAHVHNKMADYPPPARKPQPFKTDKQRRFFFAALKEGRIRVPYVRQGNLGRRWTHRVTQGGKRGIVGNNTPYGPLVQGGGTQSGYHAGIWQTDEDVAEREADEVKGFFLKEIRKYT